MNVELELSHHANAHIIQNLWPLYRHEVSKFDASFVPNRHGLFTHDDEVSTLAQHTDQETNRWWKSPESRFPYLVLADGRPAGFNLVAAQSSLPQGIDADFVVHEFFVLHPFRGKGVAEQAATLGFDRHPGRWEVVTWPTNARAISFWRRTVRRHTSSEYTEKEMDHPWGRRVAFLFSSHRQLM